MNRIIHSLCLSSTCFFFFLFCSPNVIFGQFAFSKNDSICLDKSFNYFLPQGEERYLVSEKGNQSLTDPHGNHVVDLSKYDFLFFKKFRNGLTPIKEKAGKGYGYMNRDGRIMIPFQYQSASGFKSGYASVKINNKYGLIDTLGNFIIEPEYLSLSYFCNGVVIAKKDEKYGLIDLEEKQIVDYTLGKITTLNNGLFLEQVEEGVTLYHIDDPDKPMMTYQEINGFNKSLLRFKQNGKWGLMEMNGNIVLENVYDQIGYSKDGLAVVKDEQRKGAIDAKGNLVFPLEFQDLAILEYSVKAKKDGQYYLYNKDGELTLDQPFISIYGFGPCDLFLKAKLDDGYRVFYQDGSEVIPEITFTNVREISDKFLVAEKDSLWSFYSIESNKILGPYEKASRFYNGKAIVTKNDRQMLIDRQAKVLSFGYDKIKREGDLFLHKNNGKYGIAYDLPLEELPGKYEVVKHMFADYFIVGNPTKQGMVKYDQMIIPLEYDQIDYDRHRCDYIKLMNDRKFGFADIAGNILMEPQLLDVKHCWLGLLKVETETGIGILDKKMNFLIEPIYEDLEHYEDGEMCAVKKDGLWGFVDIDGEMVLNPKFNEVYPFTYNYNKAIVREGDHWYFIDKKGNKVSDQIYSKLRKGFGSKQMIVEQNGLVGVIDRNEKILFPLVFQSMDKSRGKWKVILEGHELMLDKNFNCVEGCEEKEELLKKYRIGN